MNISRRFFIGGAASFGAFGGCRFFECHDFRAGGTPNLKFGVISDIHLKYNDKTGKEDQGWGSNATFRHTLEWFRHQGVDAVMIAGDMADNGMDDHLQAVADAWYDVFPGDRYPDGRPIEKVFVYGNHDYHGYLYGDHAAKRYPDAAECRCHVLRADMKGWWEKIFHEEYSRFYAKKIKGYTFLGQHWDDGTGMEARYGCGEGMFGTDLAAYLSVHGGEIDPALPFFYVQHPHPKDTCYGSWAWGHDGGKVTKALTPFSNAIAFSGHSHYSLTDERSLWQGAFTSVGTSSLRYTGMPYNERLPVGYENTTTEARDGWRHDAVKFARRFETSDCRQGMLWSVYDDCIVVKRREFFSNLDVGDDWVMPLPAAESKPFAFAERAKKVGAPHFAAGAALKVERAQAKNRGGKSRDGKETIPAAVKEVFTVTAPAAVADKDARAYEFEFTAEAKDGTKKTKLLMAEGFNHAPAHKKATSPTVCSFALDELPKGEVRFVVTPMNCFHRRGEPLVSGWMNV